MSNTDNEKTLKSSNTPAPWKQFLKRAAVSAILLTAPTSVAWSSGDSDQQQDLTDYCAASPLTEPQKDQLQAAIDNRTGTPPAQRADAALQLAGDAIARAQPTEKACRRTFKRGQRTFEKTLNKKTRSVSGNAGAAQNEDPAIKAVQQSLRDAFIADQAARLAYLDLATTDREGADYWAQRLSVANAISIDADNTNLLKRLLETYDWIDSLRFGPRIASHAWIIAQHADADPVFQQLALERMAPYVEAGGVNQKDYAYLFDRVAVNTGQLQRFGTQPEADCNIDGSLSPRPLEDPEAVDQRRAELGMGPMSEAMAEMAARRCGKR